MATTTGQRDRARTGTVSRPRSEETARKRLEARRERPGPKRSQDAETVDEALEIERETGRREGARTRTARPIVRYGPADKPRVDAPAALPTPAPATSSSSSTPRVGAAGIGAPLVFDVLIITADEIVNQRRPPLPSRLLVAFGVFGLLGLAKGQAARPARVFAWGIVLATFYSAAPGDKPAGLNAIQGLGSFLAGHGVTGSSSGGGPGTGSSSAATFTPADAPNSGQTQQHLRNPNAPGAQ